jgi:DNA-binding transcriptional MerR regulator
LTEYRLDDLARISGVSSRNIRAYRERGLLDPPRRQGRSAYYDDYHLSQLNTINQLLRKGYTSTHIAEFFARMREGHDLADILGIQQAVLGHGGEASQGPRSTLDIDPGCDEARRLIAYGLAETDDGAVVLVDPNMREIVARAPEPILYVQAILQVFESTRESVDKLAADVMRALQHCVTARFGPNYVPKPGEWPELGLRVQDYRDLGSMVVARRLAEAIQQQMVKAASDYTAGVLVSGQWESGNH